MSINKETMIEVRENIEVRLLLEAIYQYYGLDFRDYSLSSIKRRIWNRVKAEGLVTITGLLEKILHERDCMERLFSDFTISVTEMFRDPLFFVMLRHKVVPVLRNFPSLKVWHAGCASGEEVLSLAILFEEEGLLARTRIYATDINANLIKQAKLATCPLNKMRLYTKNYQNAGGTRSFSEYYSVAPQGVVFHRNLIKNAVYAQHNLVTDTSFNEFDLIICRNVMIYFNRNLQERVHKLLYDSLCSGGFLGLGCKEGVVLRHGERYEEIDSTAKLYRKILPL